MKTTYVMRRFPRPEEFLTPPDVDGEEISIKLMTFPIYWREIGIYFCLVWNIERDAPQVLVLNHSLFPELRDHIRRDLDNVAGLTFTITCEHDGRIVRHRLVSTGMAPLLNKDKLKVVEEYAHGLYDAIVEDEQ